MGGVYDNFKVIIQFLGDIPPQFCSNDLLGFGVKAGDAEIDLVLGVKNPNFGLFCWWLPLKGLALRKVVDWSRVLPHGIVKGSV